MTKFTEDWMSAHSSLWKKILSKFIGKPNIRAIEIGVFEGRATLWFLSEILIHKTARIICIDPYCSTLFFENTKPYVNKIRLIQEASQTALRDKSFSPNSIDFIYIDGDHKAVSVLEDAVLSFQLLKIGGVLIFDDYLWKCGKEDLLLEPQIAIDAFLNIFKGNYESLHQNWQVAIIKTKSIK